MDWFTEEINWFQDDFGNDEAYGVACSWLRNDPQFEPILCAGYYSHDYIWFVQANGSDYAYFAGWFDPYSAEDESEYSYTGEVERLGFDNLDEIRDYLNF